MTSVHTKEYLAELSKLPLWRKVGITQARIIEWYTHYEGKVFVSFSGGKDSTVLLYIARHLFPGIKAMFLDTGLEYPEIRDFVKGFDNVDWVKPKKNFKTVIEEYGYPVISKEVAQAVYEYRNNPTGCRAPQFGLAPWGKYKKSKTFYNSAYLLDAPFKISHKCCYFMKKSPSRKYEKETGLKPIIATTVFESMLRKLTWLKQGCNAFKPTHPVSTPLSFWTEQDILEYIKAMRIPIASVYGNIEGGGDGTLHCTGLDRTGCMFCLFGIKHDREKSEMRENRVQMLYRTHPSVWRYCMNHLGTKQVMDYIGEPCEPERTLFDVTKY